MTDYRRGVMVLAQGLRTPYLTLFRECTFADIAEMSADYEWLVTERERAVRRAEQNAGRGR